MHPGPADVLADVWVAQLTHLTGTAGAPQVVVRCVDYSTKADSAMTQFPNGPAPYLNPQLAWQTAERVLDSERTTRILTPDIKSPANAYVQAAVQTAAAQAIEDVRGYGFDPTRTHPGVERFGGYLRDPQAEPSRQHPAHGVAQFAMQEASWANQVPMQHRQAVVNYVQQAINNAGDQARQHVHDWSMGKPVETSPGVESFNSRMEAVRAGAGGALAGMPPAHLATQPGSAGQANRQSFGPKGGNRETGLHQG